MYYVFCDGKMGGVAWNEAEAIRACAALTLLHPEVTYGYCPVLLWDAEMERLETAALAQKVFEGYTKSLRHLASGE